MDTRRIELEDHLKEAEAFHGHLCGGIVIGVRMALLGLKEIGIQDPKGEDRKKLMVFVEIDRCATDAITSVTGCRPGKRTMKIKDYGKMAATFLNLETEKAIRISARAQKDDKPEKNSPEHALQVLKEIPDEELFHVQHGGVPLGAGDMPGVPVRRVLCGCCGESVMDMRDVTLNGEVLCHPCAEGRNYFVASAVHP